MNNFALSLSVVQNLHIAGKRKDYRTNLVTVEAFLVNNGPVSGVTFNSCKVNLITIYLPSFTQSEYGCSPKLFKSTSDHFQPEV